MGARQRGWDDWNDEGREQRGVGRGVAYRCGRSLQKFVARQIFISELIKLSIVAHARSAQIYSGSVKFNIDAP